MTARTLERAGRPMSVSAGTLVRSPLGMLVCRVLLLAALVWSWELASTAFQLEFWISRPSSVLSQLHDWVADGSIWAHLYMTFAAMIIGYAIGAAGGIGVGFALGFHPRVLKVVEPYLYGLYALPKIALAPLIVIFFGIGIESKIALVIVTVFFLVLYSTLDGVRDVDRDLATALRQMGAVPDEVTRMVLLPATLPWIFTGMRIAVRYALTAAILGELISGNQGIGFLIQSSSGRFDSAGVFAAVFLLVVCSVTITEVLTRIESVANRHHALSRG
jgi:NitT/TauT family transport system permease protein